MSVRNPDSNATELPSRQIEAKQPLYLTGFGNEFESEALPGALPQARNSPQKCNYGLYAEQLSGTPFTAPRQANARTWCYRIRPSVKHTGRTQRIDLPLWRSGPCIDESTLPLSQYRWDPLPIPKTPLTFLTGMRTMTAAGDVCMQSGVAVHVCLINESMHEDYFCSADGELLIVVQQGALDVSTELGRLLVSPGEIAVIPRGMLFKVGLVDEQPARAFVCENYAGALTLPELGPIGANGLANPRDFKTPVAHYDDRDVESTVTIKWCGGFHRSVIDHSPLDVVAWHGNHVPYQYDLRRFSPVGAIGFDHPDPSIFTVLTAPSAIPGTANVDFVIFPERWLVAEDTFRPPWYHKNIMSEFMGNIDGVYDAKPSGFVPGAMSLHNMMLPHGPDHEAFEKASNVELAPQKLERTLSFMFETRLPQQLTTFASTEAPLQKDYADCWQGLRKKFDGTPGTKP